MVDLDIEISNLLDFPDDYNFLEEEGMSNIIKEIVDEEKIENDVKSCIKDLLDNVEKAVQPSKKRPNFRKRQIKKPGWIVSKCKKAHQSAQEHVNNKGKLIPAKKIVPKKDCAAKCKFECTTKIDKETQENIFTEFYKLDNNRKHAFIAQTSVCSSIAGENQGHKKSSYTYFLMKGESSF